MARTFLIEAQPFDPATRATKAVRLAGGGRRHYTHKGFTDWRGGMVAPPKVAATLGYDANGFTEGARPTTAAIGFFPGQAATGTSLAALMWVGAAITVSSGNDEAAAPSWTTELAGTIAGYQVSAGTFAFTLSDMAGALAKPLCAATFAGTGGAEGDLAALGRVKRRSWGPCFNVEGRVLRKASNIFEFGDPARPLAGFAVVKDKGRAGSSQVDVAWAGSIDATLAALDAVTPAAGGCATAPSIAAVKWWTTPAGPLTADLLGEVGAGYVATVTTIADRVSQAAGGPAVANLLAVDATRPDAAGVHVEDAGETAAAVLDRLLLRASLAWSIGAAGVLVLRPIAFADPVETIAASLIEREAAFAPVTGFAAGYRRNHRQHSDAEISAAVLATDLVFADGVTAEAARTAMVAATTAAQATADGAAATAATAITQIGTLRATDASQAASLKQADRDRAALAQTLLRVTLEADRTRAVLRDAGVVVDPAAGTVRLYGVDALADRTGNVELLLNAQGAALALKASVDFVNQQVLAAQLGGSTADLSAIFTRLTSAEANIGGLTATVALKADATTLTGLAGTVTSLGTTLDALAGTVATKASSTVVTALDTRVASAEQTLTTLGNVAGIAVAVRQARLVADGAAEGSLRAVLAGDAAAQRQLAATADARQELYTKIGDDVGAEAAARLALAARVGASEAAIVTEAKARTDGEQSSAQLIQTLTTRTATSESSISFLLSAANGNEATATLSLGVNGVVTGFRVNGQDRSFAVRADAFRIEGAQPFAYDAVTGVLRLPAIEVDTIRVHSVDTAQMAPGSVGRRVFIKTTGDIVCPKVN